MKNQFDDITKTSLLLDFYGKLLTERQCDIALMYHDENFSLNEIAKELGISKQSVHESLKAAEKSLLEYEEKIGLVDRFSSSIKSIKKIEKEIDKIIIKYDKDRELKEKLKEILKELEKIEIE